MDPKQKRTLRDEEEGIQEYNFPPFSFLLIQQQGTTKLEWWRLLNKNLTDNSTFENLWQKWWPFTNERMYKNGPTGLDEKIVPWPFSIRTSYVEPFLISFLTIYLMIACLNSLLLDNCLTWLCGCDLRSSNLVDNNCCMGICFVLLIFCSQEVRLQASISLHFQLIDNTDSFLCHQRNLGEAR